LLFKDLVLIKWTLYEQQVVSKRVCMSDPL